jgi:hypothetical protein
MLRASVVGTAADGTRASVVYDPVLHRHWRLREQDGILYWETSPDRSSWRLLHSEPVPFAAEHVRGVIGAAGQQATATEARFEDVNLPAPSGLSYCPANKFVDEFDGAPFEPSWALFSYPSCTVAQVSGGMEMTFSGVGEAWCGATSTHLYDLRESAIVLDATAVPGATQFVPHLVAAIGPQPDFTRIIISRSGVKLNLQQTLHGVTVSTASVNYDPVAHRYWRIRASAGVIRLETSPDRQTWALHLEDTSRFDLSGVWVTVGAGHSTPGPGTPQFVRYEGINSP